MNPKSQAEKSRPIDWVDIHDRLADAGAGLEQGPRRTDAEKKAVLKARAKALACEPAAERRDEGDMEIIEFQLAYETYAVESSYVREVYPLKEFTPLPGTPPFVLGIINVRGRIVSVIDLKKFVDLPDKGLTDLNKVIIVSDGSMEFGLLTDAVCEVSRIPRSEIQAALPTLTGIRQDYLKGVTGHRLVILDIGKILADPKIVVRDEAST